MADIKQINTRIVLRNDTLENWNKSTKTLLKGEVALALRTDGSYEVRVGDGTKTWSELSGTGFGHTEYYAKTSFAELSAVTDAPNGSVGIVTEAIADGKVSKTAYTYNAEELRWEAMDGNYNADNVYFAEDFQLAGDYTQVGNIKLSEGKVSAAGKSVKSLFENIFDKTIQPTLGSAPTNSISINSGVYEVGTKVTPKYTITYTQGKYNTPWNNRTVNDGTSDTAYSVTAPGNQSSTTKTGSFAEITVTDGTNYKVSATTTYSDGVVAQDNKGNNSSPEVKRVGGTTAPASSGSITGFRYIYVGSTTSTADVDEAMIKGLTKYKSSEIGANGITKTLKASGGDISLVAGAKKIIVACPTGSYAKNLNKVLLVSASNTPITDDYKLQTTNVEVSGATAGENKIGYKVWIYQPASIDAGEVHSITIK